MNSITDISAAGASSSSSFLGKRALYICSPTDPNGVFGDTEASFQQRVIALQNSGFEVDVQRNLDTIEKVANYIDENHPEGLDYLYFRMHGSSEVGELGPLPDGRITTELTGDAQERVERICQSVKQGGVLITESCENGKDGHKNLLFYLAKLCRPEVAVIGSKVSNFEVQFCPELPKFHRCISDGIDQTRMYYQTSSGEPLEISTELFDALYELMGMGPEAMDLCFQLLREQDISEVDDIVRAAKELIQRNGQDFESFKEKLRKISVGRENLSPEWQEYLNYFQKISRDSLMYSNDLTRLRIALSNRSHDVQVIYSVGQESLDIPSIERSKDIFEDTYKFLLGMAVLDRYQSIFSLIDDGDHSATSVSARCIYALSGLAIHTTRPSTSICQILSEYIATVKQSFAEAKTQGMLFHWVESLIRCDNPCVDAKINDLGKLIVGLWDTDSAMHDEEERLLDAIEKGDIEAIKNCRENLFVKTLMDNPFESEVLSQLVTAILEHFSNESVVYQERTGVHDFTDPILKKRLLLLLDCHYSSVGEALRRALIEAVRSDSADTLRCILSLGEMPQNKFEDLLWAAINRNCSNILECMLSLPQAARIQEIQWMSFATRAFVLGKPSILQFFLNKHRFSLCQLITIKGTPSPEMTSSHIEGQEILNQAIHELACPAVDELLASSMERSLLQCLIEGPNPEISDSNGEPSHKRRKLGDGDYPT